MSEGVREIEMEAEELGAHIFRWGASSNNLPTIKFREEKEKAINQILKALTQAEKRGFDRAKSKIAEICLSPALLPNFNCFDGVCVAKAIRDLTYEEKV